MLLNSASQRGGLKRMAALSSSPRVAGNMAKDVTKQLAWDTKRGSLLCSAAAILTCAITIWPMWLLKHRRLLYLHYQRVLKVALFWRIRLSGSALPLPPLCSSSLLSYFSFRVEQSPKLNPRRLLWLPQVLVTHQTATTSTTWSQFRLSAREGEY